MTPYVEPPRRPITLWRGDNTPPISWEFLNDDGTPLNMIGVGFTLDFEWFANGASFTTANGDLTVNTSSGVVTWKYSSNTSTGFPLGPEIDYQLRAISGNTLQTWVYGPLDVRGPR